MYLFFFYFLHTVRFRSIFTYIYIGARDVMVIIKGHEYMEQSSNPGLGFLHISFWEIKESNYSSCSNRYVVHLISFQTFLVQAFKIVVDS